MVKTWKNNLTGDTCPVPLARSLLDNVKFKKDTVQGRNKLDTKTTRGYKWFLSAAGEPLTIYLLTSVKILLHTYISSSLLRLVVVVI